MWGIKVENKGINMKSRKLNRIERVKFGLLDLFFSELIIAVILLFLDNVKLLKLSGFYGLFFLFIYHLILPLFFKGRTFFMMLINIHLKSIDNSKTITPLIILKRLVLRLLYFLPIITLFISIINNDKNAVYDKKIGIYLVKY